LLRTLVHYWRVNIAVALGAAVATAVLAGALMVGDSVRGSLRDLTLDRLGRIDRALVSTRFFREELADDLVAAGLNDVVPTVVLRGAASQPERGSRASRVSILGVDERFAALYPESTIDLARREGQLSPSIVVNEALGRELGVEPGDAIVLHFARFSDVPRETLMGETDSDDVLGRLRLTVTRLIPDRGAGRFGIVPTQRIPLVAYVELTRIQRALELPDQVNALFTGGDSAPGVDPDRLLPDVLTLEDLGLTLDRGDGFVALGSREFVLRPEIDRALDSVVDELGAPMMRTQSYLANETRHGERLLPYSLVSALDPRLGLPWAGLTLVDGSPAGPIGDDEVLLNSWAAEDLAAEPGDTLTIRYFAVGPNEELDLAQTSLRVAGVVEMEGLGADSSLTPEYPGIQDARDMSAWDPPFPVDLSLVRPKDEDYWDDHGATPKLFVAEATGRRLWSTRFGSTTSARIGVPDGGTPAELEERLRTLFLDTLSPESRGLSFRPVRVEGLRAAQGATDFAMLFVSFSFFIIISAGLLVGLLFRLGVEQRSGEVGLLLALGYRVKTVRRRLLGEGLVLAALGGLVGLPGGVGYAWLLIAGLRTLWRPAVGSSELVLHVQPWSLPIGWTISVLVVLLSVWLAVRKLVRVAPQRLLAGSWSVVGRTRRSWVAPVLAYGGLFVGLGVLALALSRGAGTDPGLAFGSGAPLLISGLAFFTLWCRRGGRGALVRGRAALVGMAARNTSWNPGRSVLSIALVASASFVLVLVAASCTEEHDLERRESGSGGYALVAESDIPIYQDLDSADGLFDLGFGDAAIAELKSATAGITPGSSSWSSNSQGLSSPSGRSRCCWNENARRSMKSSGTPSSLGFSGR